MSIVIQSKSANVIFTLPPTYPDSVPEIFAEIVGISGHELEAFLIEQAETMIGLPMISYLVGEAYDFLSGAAGKTIFEQQEHITQTPFSREGFLLWLEGFNHEKASERSKIEKPPTGRQLFEQGLVKPGS